MLAWIRPESWNFPLLLHVLGATVLVGTVAAGALAHLTANRFEEAAYVRTIASRTLLLGAFPAFIVMRVGGEWLKSKEFGSAPDQPTWLELGYWIGDIGGLVLLLALILSGLATRRSNPRLSTAAGILAAITLVAWLVAIWAMGAKPT